MEAEGTLQVFAEISIAFVGFAGIVGALAGGRLRPSQPHIWLAFWAMIEGGLGTLFAALFPVLPYYLGLSERQVWASSSSLSQNALDPSTPSRAYVADTFGKQ